jgi:hypothetical protein
MKERIAWEQAKIDHPGVLSGNCPQQAVCNGETCLNPIDPLTGVRRFNEVKERVRHYSDVPDHLARSIANHNQRS